MRPQREKPSDKMRSMGPLIACLVLTITAQAASLTEDSLSRRHQHRVARRTSRSTALSPARIPSRAWRNAWTVRGGYQHGSSSSGSNTRGHGTHKIAGGSSSSSNSNVQNNHAAGRSVAAARTEEVDAEGVGGSSEYNDHNNNHNIEKIAADLLAKKDHIATHIHARGEAIAADLKAKQEKITDEVLRERSPEALGELGGHASPYDSATAGMDVASRRSFFLGIRRIVLLVQVVELLAACAWQTIFPYGGVAGFLAGEAGGTGNRKASDSAKSPLGGAVAAWEGDGRGRLGLAVGASLAQFSLYTMLLVWFGCDRVVLRAVRMTGWEHAAAAAWAMARLVTGSGGKLLHLAVCTWLAGVTFLCAYFGRQL